MCALGGVVLLVVYAAGNARFGGGLALAALVLLTLLRLVAGAAFMFLALMFFLSFADLMTRVRY